MILQGKGFSLEVVFEHTHDGRHHRHDALVADAQAHELCHRLARPASDPPETYPRAITALASGHAQQLEA